MDECDFLRNFNKQKLSNIKANVSMVLRNIGFYCHYQTENTNDFRLNPLHFFENNARIEKTDKRGSFMSDFTHINSQGRAKMVDVSEKDITVRTASAVGTIYMAESTVEMIKSGGVKKGDVLSVAQVAGIMAAKQTSNIIPMCHPIITTGIDISFTINKASIDIKSTVKCKGETGVEMEALTAVSAAALTIYDMCKALQKDMTIGKIRLVEKTGGKSGDYKWQK